jgi:hypothetical protein
MPSSYHQLNNIYQLVMSGYYISRYGMNTLKTAMVAGNYVNPTGYSYGGTGCTASARNLMDLLLKKLDLPSKTKKLVLIDVHTGLGKFSFIRNFHKLSILLVCYPPSVGLLLPTLS